MERNIEGDNAEPMEDFRITPLAAEPREAANRSCWECKAEEYTEGLRRGVLRGVYVEKLQCSRGDIKEMKVAVVGTAAARQWETRLSAPPVFIVLDAGNAVVWEVLKDIRPPVYDGNPLNVDRVLVSSVPISSHSLHRPSESAVVALQARDQPLRTGHSKSQMARDLAKFHLSVVYAPRMESTAADCLNRWAYHASMTDVSAHGDEAKTTEAKKIIGMEQMMEE